MRVGVGPGGDGYVCVDVGEHVLEMTAECLQLSLFSFHPHPQLYNY